MATNTPRLVLRKPAGSDNVNEALDLNDNWDKVDLNMGLRVCTSSTRPGTPYQGQMIYETDTNNRYFWDGSSWYLMNKKIVVKTADETINNTATLQNDNHLAIGLDAGTWEVNLMAPFTGPTAADFKSQYTFSGTISAHRRYNLGPAGTGNDNSNTIVTTTANIAFSATEQYASAAGAGTIRERFVIIVTAAGTLQWQWAQNVATVGDTTVFTRGYLTAERLA